MEKVRSTIGVAESALAQQAGHDRGNAEVLRES
jgi:hypothetical protein